MFAGANSNLINCRENSNGAQIEEIIQILLLLALQIIGGILYLSKFLKIIRQTR